MRLIRIHVEIALAEGARVTVTGPAAAHARRVLRLEPGDPLTLFNGDGDEETASISFGLATLCDDDDLASVLERSDHDLRKAKVALRVATAA